MFRISRIKLSITLKPNAATENDLAIIESKTGTRNCAGSGHS
jgi:hypothetical protein